MGCGYFEVGLSASELTVTNHHVSSVQSQRRILVLDPRLYLLSNSIRIRLRSDRQLFSGQTIMSLPTSRSKNNKKLQYMRPKQHLLLALTRRWNRSKQSG